MGTISINNSTPDVIHIRVTLTGSGTQVFSDVNSGDTESWTRDYWEVALILRDDTGTTVEFVVKPDQPTAYIVS
jgi:hypothetical protein